MSCYGLSWEGGPVTITSLSLRDGVGYSLTEAFRLAKVTAGWEVLAPGPNGKLCINEPVNRNLRGSHVDYVPAEMRRARGDEARALGSAGSPEPLEETP